MTARDYLGQELEVGDMVVYTGPNYLYSFQKDIIKEIKEDNRIFLKYTPEQRYGNQVIKIGVLTDDEM